MKCKILVIGITLMICVVTQAIAEQQDKLGNFEIQDLMSRFNQAESTAQIKKGCQRYNGSLVKVDKKLKCVAKTAEHCRKIGGKVERKSKQHPKCIIGKKALKKQDSTLKAKPADHAVPGIEGTDIGSGG